MPGVTLQNEACETNLVFFDVSGTGKDARDVAAQLIERGVRIGASSAVRMRAVTHLDVDAAGIDFALDVLRKVLR